MEKRRLILDGVKMSQQLGHSWKFLKIYCQWLVNVFCNVFPQIMLLGLRIAEQFVCLILQVLVAVIVIDVLFLVLSAVEFPKVFEKFIELKYFGQFFQRISDLVIIFFMNFVDFVIHFVNERLFSLLKLHSSQNSRHSFRSIGIAALARNQCNKKHE